MAPNGMSFFIFSHDAKEDRIIAQKAQIQGKGTGMAYHVRTDVGTYEVSEGQAFRTHSGKVVPVKSLQVGEKLQSCELENVDGFIFIHGGKGVVPLHELIDSELSGEFRLALPDRVRSKARRIQEVLEVKEAGITDVYRILIGSSTVNDHDFNSGHNYLMWPDGTSFGSGILVH